MTFREKLDNFRKNHPYSTLRVPGAEIRYYLSGEGSPLVFLNGGMNISEMWMDYLERLEQHHRVLLFDYPMGLTTNQALVRGMDQMFRQLGIEKPVLIGASDGGMVAQLYTQYRPDNVGGLILCATGGMDEKTIRSLRKQYFFTPVLLWYMKRCNYEKFKKKLAKAGAGHAKGESPEVRAYVLEMFQAMFEGYPREKDLHVTGLLADLMHQVPVTAETFAHLKGKILLMLPDHDFFSQEMQQSLLALMPEPKLVPVHGGHISTVLRPEEFLDAMEEFLQTL